jgi:hypothetical protein
VKLLELNDTKSPYEHIANNIISTCKPFLELINYDTDEYVLYRGAGKSLNPVIILPGYRDNRKPRDIPIHLHAAINRVFKTKFGIPFRNGTFTTSNMSDAETYSSTIYVVIPLGEFKFIWSPQISDLFNYLNRKTKDLFGTLTSLYHEEPKVIGTLLKYIDTPEFESLYQNTNLRAGITSGHEVMLYADNCYYINCSEYTQISKLIQLNRTR